MLRIDSHQHYWKYHPVKDSWIDETMPMLRRDFFPEEVYPQMLEHGVTGCVAVQADQSETETMFLLELAKKYSFIQGVVGWIDFRRQDIADRLEYFSQFPLLKGFRHIVQSEEDDRFLLNESFCKGISCLLKYDYTYDILIYPKHINYAFEFVQKFPGQRFVIDHLAKPFIKQHLKKPWEDELAQFREMPNVYCKLAGLVTLADWNFWKISDFQYYVDTVFNIFGPERIMFGTDWPVCLTGGSYGQVLKIVEATTGHLPEAEKEKIWATNCSNFYKLSV